MRRLDFCFGSSRQARKWTAGTLTLDELYERLRNPIVTPETTEQYRAMKRGERDDIKDKGGFLAGTLKDGLRRVASVVSRSMISLDADRLSSTFFEEYELLGRFETIVYTTHSHLPEAPRARLLVPLTRDVTPDEFDAISRLLADEVGMEMFDPCSFQINQMMFWPTVSSDGEYICRRFSGEWLDPDSFLAEHPDWRDCEKLPKAAGEKEVIAKQRRKQEDPLGKAGTVGVFCRAYSIAEAISKFIPDIYEPTDDETRWRYKPSQSMAGMIVYDGKFAYSHHATDPAYGKLLNAFDLVRTHLFDGDDAKASFTAMAEFATRDDRVRELTLRERQARAGADFETDDTPDDDESWKKQLTLSMKTAQVENTLANLRLIMEHDPYIRNIVFNQLADRMEIKGEVPWQHPGSYWRDADDAQLICYIDENYGGFSQRNYENAVTKVADDRSYHPIRDYFSDLSAWDGVPRVDTLLIDYLGAEDSEYVRAVTRKALCAAYQRVYHPGIKFDYMLVLSGAQGIGKSTLISKLGMEWFSDSLNLSDMNDKTAAEKLQGYWIMEIGELAGLKKADLDKVKAFISRQDDKFRAAFGRRVTSHPRQCIFFGTTNNENGYLRDITGNRRYWNVRVRGNGKLSPWDMTRETIDQIWAEVRQLADAGEKLFLPMELEDIARAEQREAIETDDRAGFVEAYLNTPLPDDWNEMDLGERRSYLDGDCLTRKHDGAVRRQTVSALEIWCECFGRRKEDMQNRDSYAISLIMSKIKGWEKRGAYRTLSIYGRQRVFERV